MAGTELKLSDAGKFRQLREFPGVHDPASAFVASIAIATARVDGSKRSLTLPSVDDLPDELTFVADELTFVDRSADVYTAVVGSDGPK